MGGEGEGPPPLNQPKDDHWAHFDNSVNAVSFGFIATAILVSMFLLIAIFEKFLRTTSPELSPSRRRRRSSVVEAQNHVAAFKAKLGYYPSHKFLNGDKPRVVVCDLSILFLDHVLMIAPSLAQGVKIQGRVVSQFWDYDRVWNSDYRFTNWRRLWERAIGEEGKLGRFSWEDHRILIADLGCCASDIQQNLSSQNESAKDSTSVEVELLDKNGSDSDVESDGNEEAQGFKIQGRVVSQFWDCDRATEVSVVMPGEKVPTFIAHPTPAPCPPERGPWPLHNPDVPFPD
ncbi:hypothetical protein SASPL_154159 [Salvia splendens]|uniref:Uncharacterized protein n=1 Tax=Salvia splendens TaxID=180675 RepID=A0A8X8VZL6_SALSN|nr:hypothetical protein SASPL_154159 [Salvia splendens]